MKKSEKLKLVFDFIADYLSDESSEAKEEIQISDDSSELTITENEDAYKRAYTLMKKMDEINKIEAEKKAAVREAVNPIKNQLKKVKEEADKKAKEEKEILDAIEKLPKVPLSDVISGKVDAFKERTGVTLDDEGKISEVSVGNLRDYVPISDVMENVGPSLNDVRDEDTSKAIARGKALKSVLKVGKKNY